MQQIVANEMPEITLNDQCSGLASEEKNVGVQSDENKCEKNNAGLMFWEFISKFPGNSYLDILAGKPQLKTFRSILYFR